QVPADRLIGEHRPARALDAQRRRGEVIAELVERAEELVDRLRQLTGGLVAALRGEVLPEDRVVRVTTEVERQILRELVHRREVTGLPRRRELLQRRVRTLHIGRMMLGVMQLHDLPGDRRSERPVVVVEIRKRVLRHGLSFRRCSSDDATTLEPQPSLRSTGASWTVSVRLLLRVVGPVVLDDVLEPAGSGPGLGEGVVGVQQRTGLEREAAAADAAGELVFEALDRAAPLLEPLLPASRG